MSGAVRILLLVLCWITVAVCGVMSHLTATKMRDEVNERLADEDKMFHWGARWSEMKTLMRRYRQFYPSGRRIARVRTLGTVMMIAGAVASLAIGLWPGALMFGIFGTAGVRYFYK